MLKVIIFNVYIFSLLPTYDKISTGDKMKILLATNNEHKVKEFNEIFEENKVNIELLSLKEFEKVEEPVEDGNSFYENALIKAKYYYDLFKIPVLADDSGLVVDALNGEPGIHSARFASTNTHNASSKDNRIKLLKLMEDETNRKAHFVCSLIFYDGEKIINTNGEFHGEVALRESGENGFGYDSIFYLPEYGKIVSSLDEKTKNKLSHRYKAVKAMIEKLNF